MRAAVSLGGRELGQQGSGGSSHPVRCGLFCFSLMAASSSSMPVSSSSQSPSPSMRHSSNSAASISSRPSGLALPPLSASSTHNWATLPWRLPNCFAASVTFFAAASTALSTSEVATATGCCTTRRAVVAWGFTGWMCDGVSADTATKHSATRQVSDSIDQLLQAAITLDSHSQVIKEGVETLRPGAVMCS